MPASKTGIWKNPRHGTSTGYANYKCRCKECCAWNARAMRRQREKNPQKFKDYNRAWYLSHPEETRRDKVLRRYNITPKEYASILESQNGQCGICLKTPENGISLHVDHDHSCCRGQQSCGKCIRGLLCAKCNNAIALLGDDAEGVNRAMKYLSGRHRNVAD